MNTKNNEQFKSNEKTMLEIFMNLLKEKDISKITVREICNEAHVNRSTFYNHFMDIYDMLDKAMQLHAIEVGKLFQYNKPSKDSKENLSIIFEHILNNQIFYKAAFQSLALDQLLNAFDFLFKFHEVDDYENLSKKEKKKIDYQTNFYEKGIFSTLSYWLNHDCDLSVDEIVDIIIDFYPTLKRPH